MNERERDGGKTWKRTKTRNKRTSYKYDDDDDDDAYIHTYIVSSFSWLLGLLVNLLLACLPFVQNLRHSMYMYVCMYVFMYVRLSMSQYLIRASPSIHHTSIRPSILSSIIMISIYLRISLCMYVVPVIPFV